MLRSRRFVPAALLAGALLFSSGCYNALFYASPGAHLDMKVSAQAGTPFEVKIRNSYSFWGIWPRLKHFPVDEIVSQGLGWDVKHISGLSIVQYKTFGYFLIQIGTLGIYTPRTLVIRGTAHEGPPPAPPAPNGAPPAASAPPDQVPDPAPAPPPGGAAPDGLVP